MTKNFTKLMAIAILCLFGSLSTTVNAQAVGDYGSAGTNNAWNTASNWVVCTTAGSWFDASNTSVAPLSTTNVWIRNGHTITLPGSGNCLCKDLNIEAGGLIKSANLIATPRYLRVSGNNLNVSGQLGSSATDGLGVQLSGGISQILTIGGSGTINLSRLQPQTAGAVILDANVQFNYAGSGGTGSTGLYSNGFDFIVTINAGKTVTMANNSYLAVHGSSGGSAGAVNMTLNINGTLAAPGSNSIINLNTASGKTVNVNVGSAGKINTYAPLRADYRNAGTVNINVANGGEINSLSTGTLALSKAALTVDGTINMSGTNNDTLGISTVGTSGLVYISKSNGANALSGAMTLNGSLFLNTGKLLLANNNLTLNSTGGILNASASNYIVTNGTGALIQSIPATTEVLFPIGASITSYDPVSVQPTDATVFSAKVGTTLSGTPASGYQYTAKEWNLTPTTPSATIIKMTPSAISASGLFNIIGHYVDGDFVNKLADKSGNTYTGTYSTFSPFVTGTSDTPTAINTTNAKMFVSTIGNQAIVNGTIAGELVTVYNTKGQLVKQLNATNNQTTLNLKSGLYLVKIANNVLKVTI